MRIHAVLQERRRALGLTQEQIAESLGVTTPAVNKWERGSTCPDISLLPPLARLLRIDLNTLLGFHEDMTERELALFCGELCETALSDGMEAAFSLAREKLREYPNSDTLLHTLALQLQGLLATAGAGEADVPACTAQLDAWYEKLTQSGDAVIRNSACFMLAGRALSEGQPGRAQGYLDQLPNRSDTPDKRILQAAVWQQQDRAEEAAGLMERTLLSSALDLQMVLYRLIEANTAAGDHETAACVAERTEKLLELLDLSHYNTLVAPFQMALARRDAAQTVELLREMLDALSGTWELHASPLYRRLPAGGAGASPEKLIRPMLQAIRQDPGCAFLREDPAFQALLAEYGSDGPGRTVNPL